MEPGHEVETPTIADATPLPIQVDALAVVAQPPVSTSSPHLTTASVLLAIAATDGPWFPANFATETSVPRDSLDEPLAELRLAGLVRVAEWVRGLGQGYALTPEGKDAATNPAALERLKQAAGGLAAPPFANVAAEDATGREPSEPPRETELILNPPIVVPALLMANVLWFFVCAVWSIRWGLAPARVLSESHRLVLQRFGAVSGEWLLQGEWWRLFTSCFVHIGALHLLGNMFVLAMMGPLAELLWGRGRLLLIYAISGLAGSSLAMVIRPDSILAGASGAIWGIQMSLFAWLFMFRRHLPPHLASDWFRRLVVVFVLNAGVSFLPNVSWEGHLGGGVAGFLVAGLLNAARYGDRPRRVGAWLLLTLLPVLCVAGVAGAMGAKGIPGWQKLRQRLAAEEFNNEVVPRLGQLAPKEVKPIEANAILSRFGSAPSGRIAARTKLESLKATAAAVVQLTTHEPTGDAAFDQYRDRARAFAAAQSQAFERLLELLAADGPPSMPAWKEWQKEWQIAQREADRLWAELVAK